MADPLDVAARALRQGTATPLCPRCFRLGDSVAMEAFVGRPLAVYDHAYLWHQCPSCGEAMEAMRVPIPFLLAAEVRAERVAAAAEMPRLVYSLDDGGDHVSFWIDPGDGGGLVKLGHGPLSARNPPRVRGAFDLLAGGDARVNVEVVDDEPTET